MHDYSDYGITLNGKSGVEVSTTCPECSKDRTKQRAPCLRVNTVKQTWFCHHCGFKGGLGANAGADNALAGTGRPRLQPIVYTPKQERDPRLIEWFHQRGISAEVVAAHAIGLESRWFADTGADTPAITFPYFFNGECVNKKYRSLEGKNFSQEKGGLKVLYGIDNLRGSTVCVVVEGEIDAITLGSCGIPYGVSVPDGAPAPGSKSTDLKFEYLQNCKAQLDQLTKIIIAVDNDAPGKTLEAELIRRLGPDRCWRVTWPADCKDANDVLVKFGAEVLKQCIEAAKPVPIEGVICGADIADDLIHLYRNGTTKGVSTGIPGLDAVYLPRTGEWTTVIGIPMRGKSTFVETMLVSMAKLHDWSFAVCSPESLPVERHAARFIEKYIGRPFYWRNGHRMNEQQMMDGMEWFNQHFYSIAPEEMVTPDSLIHTAKGLVRKYGVRGVLMDPWNEFLHQVPSNKREDQYLAEVLGKITRFARECDVHVWIVAHPHQMEKNRDGSYPVVRPYDINGGSMFHNKSYNILSIHRPDSGAIGYTEVHAQKIKFWGETGYPGMVGLILDPISGQYSVAQQTVN